MKIINRNYRNVKRYQMGGEMAPEEASLEAPMEEGAPEGGADPMALILLVAALAVQTLNCEAAMAVCQALVQIAQGGGGAPAEEPTFARYGAKLTRVR